MRRLRGASRTYDGEAETRGQYERRMEAEREAWEAYEDELEEKAREKDT